MATVDDIQIVGIQTVHDQDRTSIKEQEVKLILNDALDIGPLLPSLYKDLEFKGKFDKKTGTIYLVDIVKTLYSNSFLS